MVAGGTLTPSLGDFWTYCWRLLSNCSVLAVWSNFNQQPIHSHLPRQRGSCKQISPTFVTYPASFFNAVFPLFWFELCDILNKIVKVFAVWTYAACSHAISHTLTIEFTSLSCPSHASRWPAAILSHSVVSNLSNRRLSPRAKGLPFNFHKEN